MPFGSMRCTAALVTNVAVAVAGEHHNQALTVHAWRNMLVALWQTVQGAGLCDRQPRVRIWWHKGCGAARKAHVGPGAGECIIIHDVIHRSNATLAIYLCVRPRRAVELRDGAEFRFSKLRAYDTQRVSS